MGRGSDDEALALDLPMPLRVASTEWLGGTGVPPVCRGPYCEMVDCPLLQFGRMCMPEGRVQHEQYVRTVGERESLPPMCVHAFHCLEPMPIVRKLWE